MADPREKLYVCSCFYYKNYFIQKLNVHVSFENGDQFHRDYENSLKIKYKLTDEAWVSTILELEKEQDRRRRLGPETHERMSEISNRYKPRQPYLFKLQESMFSPSFLRIIELAQADEGKLPRQTGSVCELKSGSRIFSFPVFTDKFCKDFVDEIVHFEESSLPKGRPNTMNNYGILVDEMGLDPKFLVPFREEFLAPLCRVLFPDWGGGSLDSHKAFVVKYKVGEDTALSYHYDNAEVTLNVALGGDFDEGSLYFGNMRTEAEPRKDSDFLEYSHRATHGILHRGQHKHGALPITGGVRYNLIIWMRSSEVRNKLCPMCDREPELVETVGRGDGFTKPSVDVCSLT